MPRIKLMFGFLAIGVGIFGGIGLATFHYANGTSYFSTDPAACANCHIMNDHHSSWQKSSHHTVATCVDCHMPTSFFRKFASKGIHGWNHSKGFTLQDFDEPIRISKRTENELQENCIRCHGDLAHAQTNDRYGTPNCLHCHADVGHGPRAGLGGPFDPQELEIANDE